MTNCIFSRLSLLCLTGSICFITLWLLFKPQSDYSSSHYSSESTSSLRRLSDHSNIPISKHYKLEEKLHAQSFSMNYNLWSKKADLVNWANHTAMCDNVMSSTPGDNLHFRSAIRWTPPYAHSDQSIADLLSDCDRFRELVPFARASGSEEESDYPLAYVIVGARNAAQTVRLLRMIYQPQNAYCLTYDNKSSAEYQYTIRRLVDCVPGGNVFLSPHNEVIDWGGISILRSEMNCLKLLLEKSDRIPWKYVQLLSWNDFPLRSNAELVKIFKAFNGSQDSALLKMTAEFFVSETRPVPPSGLTMYKGSHANTMTREFVEFIFTNPTAVQLYEWLDGTHCPEEFYLPTLIHNAHLNAPGLFPGQCYHYYNQWGTEKPWLSRYEIWFHEPEKCKGKIVNYSCAFGVLDIIKLIKLPHFVVHKIYEELQPATAFCLEQWFWRNYGNESAASFDTSYYENLPSVRYEKMRKEGNAGSFLC